MKKIILILLTLATAVSCTKEHLADSTQNTNVVSIKVKAIAPTHSNNIEQPSKTTLVDHSQVFWTKGDEIKVLFCQANKNSKYGASGILSSSLKSENASNSYFITNSWTWAYNDYSSDISRFRDEGIAVYPSTVTAKSSADRTSSVYMNANTDIHYDLPLTQLATINSFACNTAFSYASVNKNEFNSSSAKLEFKNACALLKITLPSEEYNIKSILVESIDAKSPLSGTFAVPSTNEALGAYRDTPSFPLQLAATDGNPTVVLTADEGEVLETGATYYIVVWPGTHSSGLSFTFTNVDGKVCTKLDTRKVTLTAAKYNSYIVSSLDFTEIVPEVSISQENLSFSANEESKSITINSNVDWNISSNANWITVTPNSGEGSIYSSNINVSVSSNTAFETRAATLTLTAGSLVKTINISQAAAEKRYYIKELVSKSTDLASGSKYVIFFAQNTNEIPYCWKANDDDRVEKAYISDKEDGFTSEYVFEYVNGYYSAPSQGGDLNYKYRKRGCLKSLKTSTMFSSSMYLASTSTAQAMNFAFCSQWATDPDGRTDIDIWGQVYESGAYVWKTLYWDGNGMRFGTVSEGEGSRKWYIYKVE